MLQHESTIDFNPQQIYREFTEITFDTRFDSGNLYKVDKMHNDQYHLWIANDCCNTDYQIGYRQWFFFKVSNFQLEKQYTFVVKNINSNFKLFQSGMLSVIQGYTPVVSVDNKEYQNISQSQIFYEKSSFLTELTIKYKFKTQTPHYFAFSQPYTYEQNQKQILDWENQYSNHKEIYFHRECIAYSLHQRKIDMITISSFKNITKQREKLQLNGTRPFIFNKQYIFFSARVHPSEIPASHTLLGAIESLLQNQILLDNFVFQIVPIINPDGVYRGHHRVDTLGQNLNRFYANPVKELQPAIWAIDQIINSINKKLYMIMDFHSHSTKKGNFIHGNCQAFQQQVETALFTKLLSLNSQDFDNDACDFSEKNMYSADAGDGLSKDGSARVSFYKKYKIQNCFTIECNYAVSSKKNIKYEKKQILPFQFSNQEFMNWYDPKFQERFEKYDCQYFIIQNYKDLGDGIIQSILDINELNKENCLANSPFKRIQFLKYFLAIKILKQSPFNYQQQLKMFKKTFNIKNEKFIPSFIELRSLFEKKEFSSSNKSKFRIQTKSANPKNSIKGLNNQ